MARAAADGLDRGRWRELAELGVFGLTRPEAAGGAGLQLVDAAIVFEELGRALVPGPLVASFLATDPAAGEPVADGRTREQTGTARPGGQVALAGRRSGGDRTGTASPGEQPAPADPRGEQASEARRDIDASTYARDESAGVGDGDTLGTVQTRGRLTDVLTGEVVATLVEPRPGQPVLVEHLGSSDVVLVLGDDGVSWVDAAAVADVSRPVGEPVDPTTPLWLVDDLPDGEALGGAELADRWRRVGTVLTAALLVGVAQRATDMAVAYAKDRQQFGRAIGSFQSLKHMMADMFARTEVARAGLHAAAVVADDPEIGDVERAVAGARTLAGEAAVHNTKDCIQVHGGIGFTWEADPHLLYKRALLYETQFGSVDESAALVAHRLVTTA